MAKIEGYWDCPYCGNKAIHGRERVCPGCGKTRAADTRFYMLEKTLVADESAVEKGPDWFCPYCESYNPHSAAFCTNCGHPREQTDQDYFSVREDRERKEQEHRQELNQLAGQPTQPARQKSGAGRRILVLALIAALILACVAGLSPKSRAVTVLEKSWERTVDVEKNVLVEENGWSVPSDAVEVLRSQREIHHYDQILDHYETVTVQRSREVLDGYDTYTTYNDMGNGYFETEEHSTPRYRTEYYTETEEQPVYVSVPVYETKYYYTAYRWVYDRTETAAGAGDPAWPLISLADNEREGDRHESYSVLCADKKGHETRYDCDLSIYQALDTGGKYDVRTRSGRILELK